MAESPFSDDLDLDFLNWASGLSGAESADTLGELENLFVDPGESVDSGAHSDTDITGESELPPSNVAFLFGKPEVAPPEVQEPADGWGELERFLNDPTPQEPVDFSAHSDYSDTDITGESASPPSNVAFLFGEPEVTPPEVQESANGGGELEGFFTDLTLQEPVDLGAHSNYSDTDITGESELPPSNVAFLFGEPEVAPVPHRTASPAKELTLPPPLWTEIGHLFQTPAFKEVTPNQPANPAIASAIDTLSQAMLANDGDTIQTLVQQIQETYDELKSIEIFLAATRNLCY